MQIKKETLRKRLQRSFDRLTQEKKDYEAKFAEYKAAKLLYLDALKKQVEGMSSFEEYEKREGLPEPQRPGLRYGWNDHFKRIQRNLALLDILEGDVIEVEQLKTGKGYSLGTLLDSLMEEPD